MFEKNGAAVTMIAAALAALALAIPGNIHEGSTRALAAVGLACFGSATVLAWLAHQERPRVMIDHTQLVEAFGWGRENGPWQSEDQSSYPIASSPMSGAGTATVESLRGWPLPPRTERFWFIHLVVENVPKRGSRTATNVRGHLTFRAESGAEILQLNARWSSTPQGGDIARTLTTSKMDLVARDPQPLDIAFKGTRDTQLFAFNDATYHRADWRSNPLGDRVRVEVRAHAGSD